jgi:predicted nucleotidyltransferase component of viral defense system
VSRHSDPVAHSVHDRLLALATRQREDFNAVLARYGVERLLYRLTCTAHGPRFVLKGAALFVVWLGRAHRPTRDLDLLGSGQMDEAVIRGIFDDVCEVPVTPDGLHFDPATITVAPIRADQEYGGLRVKVHGTLGTARVSVQVDVGLGDAVTPPPSAADYPTLLDLPAPRIKVYPRETVVAEKLDALMELGLLNTRLKDYYDLYVLAHHFAFEGTSLRGALGATLTRRGRTMPRGTPVGLTDAFAGDPARARQWAAFLRSHPLAGVPLELLLVVRGVEAFAAPVIQAVGTESPFTMLWPAGGGWQHG